MRRNHGSGIATVIVAIILLLTLAIGIGSSENIPTEGVVATYDCNYRVLSLDTQIETTDKDGNPVTIKGDIFRMFEDPLSMIDKDGNVIVYAGDAYNFVTQNDHGIYVSEEHVYDVIGEFKFLADSYTVNDAEGNKVAYVEFNMWDTVGKMYTADGTLIAQYTSGYFNHDYTVSIFDTNEIDENIVQMIFASYVSDKEADNSSK